MFLGSYTFVGDPDELLAAYERLIASMGTANIELHVCAVGEHEITIFDACPSREIFDGFSTGMPFREAIAAAGLPAPTVHPIGTVRAALVAQRVGL